MNKRSFLGLVLIMFSVGLHFLWAEETPLKQELVPVLTKIGSYTCGRQPKQVLFSPDSKYIIMPLLADTGFDIFSVADKKITKRITPPDSKQTGFAEGLFVPEKNAFFVSQMTTGKLHEYSYPGFEYKRSISTEAEWSKFIAWSPEKQLLAVSNWISNTISIIDYETGTVQRQISTAAAPRGLYFINNGKEIISLAFDGGKIEKFDVDTGKLLDKITISKSAMRHIVVNKAETNAYISDMYFKTVYDVDLSTFAITKQIKVFNNPNTIDLYADRWLFVSCRGPNNPEDYTKRSPKNGQIYIIDTNDMTELTHFEGGNQPTGLDISPDGRFLCFSNFQDRNIELYSIELGKLEEKSAETENAQTSSSEAKK